MHRGRYTDCSICLSVRPRRSQTEMSNKPLDSSLSERGGGNYDFDFESIFLDSIVLKGTCDSTEGRFGFVYKIIT